MLRTRTDVSGPHHALSLGPLGARGKLLSDGRLGKPGRWTVGLAHCHVPRRALGLQQEAMLERDPGSGPSTEDSLVKPSLCPPRIIRQLMLCRGGHVSVWGGVRTALHKLCPKPNGFLGQEMHQRGRGWGVSAVFQDGSGDSTGLCSGRTARIKYPTCKQSTFWSSMAGA